MGQLRSNNKNVVHEEDGNIVVINTCGFIDNAKQQSIDTILENGFIILKESESNHSPISVLLYEYYDNIDDLKRKIEALQDNLQCIVSENLYKNEISFGQTQSPELYDYADNVDTINFLLTK